MLNTPIVSPLDFADGVPAVPAAFGASENFGAEALRNLISGLQQPKLRDLLDSLETAERMLGRCPAADKPHYTKLVRQLRAKVSAQMVDDGEPGDPDFVEPPEPHDDRVDSPVAVAVLQDEHRPEHLLLGRHRAVVPSHKNVFRGRLAPSTAPEKRPCVDPCSVTASPGTSSRPTARSPSSTPKS